MKNFTALLLLIISFSSQAQLVYAPVVQAQPQFNQVLIGRICETSSAQPARDNTGAVFGGIVGGVIGSNVGKGEGRVAATGVGAATGAIIGDRMANKPQYVETCRPQYESRQVGTQVAIEYNGQRVSGYVNRSVQVGDQVRIRINLQIQE